MEKGGAKVSALNKLERGRLFPYFLQRELGFLF